jgi:hypothetical protein
MEIDMAVAAGNSTHAVYIIMTLALAWFPVTPPDGRYYTL